ncbi:oligosaccharide flippase family protein [Enterococcus faecium]|uniref:oligosaccharide flippase family protein n=1 Tax=Enterococcus faecium TaxID=1352 RepID=UPI00296B0562|nr:oligosaccharide flippase family protein [Enterococcus faecium]MDW3710264.1 oligosaccharide flippase family protein [Enterococcus faecium]
MKKKSTIQEIINVSISNLCIVFSGVFVGFIIPKVLGVTEYGYYKIFTLYTTYVSIFSFGISEGLYLKYSGTEYEDLDKRGIRFYTRFLSMLQILMSLVVAIIAVSVLPGEYKYIFVAVAIYMVELNITVYYQYVAQMTMRFKDYSARNLVKSLFTIISVVLMYLIYRANGKEMLPYKLYVGFVLVISTILLVMYIYKFRDITFGKSLMWKEKKGELLELIKIGVPFVIASLCATLILSIDRQFVSLGFDTATYGIYAFAYNMLSLVTVCTSAISTVLYPTLKQSKDGRISEQYPMLVSYVAIFIFFALSSYFPLCIVVKYFLPQYMSSLVIFRIVFPGLAFSAVISVVMQNYYKLLNKNQYFFYINLIVLIVSIVTNYVALIIWRTPQAISWASIVTLVFYYVAAERFFVKEFKVVWKKNLLYCSIMAVGFYLITLISNVYFGFVIYAACCIGITLFMLKKESLQVIMMVKKKVLKS